MSKGSSPRRVAGFLAALAVAGLALWAEAAADEPPPLPGDMTLITGRAFTMGSDPWEGDDDEEPEHQAYVSAFCIDLYEVTNAQYADALSWAAAHGYAFWSGSNVMQSRSHWTLFLEVSNVDCRVCRAGSVFAAEPGYEDHPVVEVSWYGAAAYCNWISLIDGLTPCYDTDTWKCDFSVNGYRLPTEAEWERAARGTRDERTYPWGFDAPDCERANCWQDRSGGCVGGTAPVGSCPSGCSPYGLYDMAGNVWEWCNDWYDESYYRTSPERDPRGPSRGTYRVLRGGSWYFHQSFIRCANRYANPPALTSYVIGFRCAHSE
jgi:formylglycine-generating enzyme required for sulfatase activity